MTAEVPLKDLKKFVTKFTKMIKGSRRGTKIEVIISLQDLRKVMRSLTGLFNPGWWSNV